MIRTNNESVVAEGMLLTWKCQESSSGIRLTFWLAPCQGPLQVAQSNQEAVDFFPAYLQKRIENLRQLHGGGAWVE